MATMNLEMIVKAKDFASKQFKQVLDNVKRTSKNIDEISKQTQKNQQNAANNVGKTAEQIAKRQLETAKRLNQAKEHLGIRSEHRIQREIQRTIAAYNRLQRSGTASSKELARAAEAQRLRLAKLNEEMVKVEKSHTRINNTGNGQRLTNIGRGVMGVAAGVTAGAMVMAQPMKREMDFDRQLAMTANTAFVERDVQGRIAGKKALFDAVEKAVNAGGGSKEEALGALDTMIASGAVSAQTAINLLPTLQKGAVATGADPNDLAKIAISSMQQFGIREEDIGIVLDKAVAAGQAGNFELADMARWLPKQMAAAKQAGISGLEGLDTLLVANQQARVTAGTSDEAGNNLVDLLAKMTAKETNERFKNLKIKGKDGKEHGVDFIASMEAEKASGKNSLEAFNAIMDMIIGEDEQYKQLQERLKTASSSEQKTLLDQMTNLMEGKAIGQILSDRQALMAYLGIRNNLQLGNEVKESLADSEGAVDKSHAVIADTNAFKTEQLKNTADFAQMKSMKELNDKFGDVSEKLTEYAQQYPNLTAALTGAATGISALGTAALAAAGSVALLGGGKGVGNVLKNGTQTATAVAAGGVASKAKNVIKAGAIPLIATTVFTSPDLDEETQSTLDLQHKVQAGQASDEEKLLLAKRIEFARKEALLFEALRNTDGGWGSTLTRKSVEIDSIKYLENRLATGDINQEQRTQILERINRYAKEESRLYQPSIDLSAHVQSMAETSIKLAEGISALANQHNTIQNHITVDLDSRVVAEQVSEYQYQHFNRGQ
ncbi:phage tail tape measure protein [Volucribacter amazonae]|uniref:phage tail tape measure protein n=1 Tax=Volucribacter amazonae TaxID=256731 RepID=UPI0024414DEA|nr:phage tail tape measure protein [Volucribacter amazonae]